MAPPKHRTDPRLERSPVRIARKLRGLSVREAAEQSGVSAATIYRTEKGDVDPDDDQPKHYLTWLGLTSIQHGPKGWIEAPAPKLGASVAMVKAMAEAGTNATPESYYEAMVALAQERSEPKSVMRHLAKSLSEAPPGVGWTWWFRRYLDAPRS